MTFPIIYTVITRNKKIVLCEYTEYSGNFQQISLYLLNKLKNNEQNQFEEITNKMAIDYDLYKFYFMTEDLFYFMCLVKKEEEDSFQKFQNAELIYEFLENLKNKFFNFKIRDERENNKMIINSKVNSKDSQKISQSIKDNLKTAPAYSIKEFIPTLKFQMEKSNKKIKNNSFIVNNSMISNDKSKLLFNEIKSDGNITMIVNSPTINSEKHSLKKKKQNQKWVKKCLILGFLCIFLVGIILAIIFLFY